MEDLEQLIILAQTAAAPYEKAAKMYKNVCIALLIMLALCLYYIFSTPTYINLEQPNTNSNNNIAKVE